MKKLGPFGVMALVLLAACQQSEKTVSDESEEHGEMNVSVVASISQQNQKRTVNNDGDESIFSFCAGDEMGIFSENGTVCKWELTNLESGNRWQPENPMKWPDENESQEVTFYAYSPYTGDASEDGVVMPNLSEQTGELVELGKYDFLVARCTTTYKNGGGEVRFVDSNAFKHVSSLIAFFIKGEPNLANAKIQKVLFKAAGIATQAKYVFKDAEENSTIEALPLANIANELELNINKIVSEKGMKVYAIINPLNSDLKLSLTYERDKVGYETKETTLGTEFLSNNMYTFSVSIKKGELIITGTDILPWNPNDMGDIIMDEVKKEDIIKE